MGADYSASTDSTSSEAEVLVPKFGSAVTNLSATEVIPEPGPSRLPLPRKHSTLASNPSGSGTTTSSRSLSSSDLSRFSYNPPQSLRDMIKKRGEREAQRNAQFGPPEPLRKSKAVKPAAHRFTADFTDEELSRVLRCVSCGDRWTVRKGATAKMRHIQSCAKKNCLSDDIIKRLIRADLEAPEEPKPQKKTKTPRVSNTLFEDALGDTGGIKRRRKPVQRTTTLHNPVDNREAILAKARSLLTPEITNLSQDPELFDLLQKSDSTMDRIQMFDFSDPPATQEFGRSKLGRQTSSVMLSGLSDSSSKTSAASSLVGTAKGRTREEADHGSVSPVVLRFERLDNEFQPISVHSSIDIPFERLSLEPLDFQDGDVQSDHGTEVSWYNDSAIIHYNQSDNNLDWDNNDFVHDDAILRFSPGEIDRPLLREPSPQLDETLVPASNAHPATVDSATPMPRIPAERVKERKTGKPRSRKKKTDGQSNNSTQFAEVNDTEFKSKMLDAIRGDDELYHRILRYEVCSLTFLFTSGVTKLIERKHSRSLWTNSWVWLWCWTSRFVDCNQGSRNSWMNRSVVIVSVETDFERSPGMCRRFIFRHLQMQVVVRVHSTYHGGNGGVLF